MAWNLIILFLLLYTATLVPGRTVFRDDETWESHKFLLSFDILVDLLYLMDLILNFFMAFEDRDKKLEIRLKEIASNYLRSWFLPDLLSCVPFQHVDPAMMLGQDEARKSGNLTMIFKNLKLFKLVRLLKYSRSIKKILQRFKVNQGIKRMISVALTMLCLVHLVGCFFFLVAKFEGLGEDTWVYRADLVDEMPYRQYIFSINWAL